MNLKNLIKNSMIATVGVMIVVVVFYFWLDLPISAYFYYYPHPLLTEISCVYFKSIFASQIWLILSLACLCFGLLSYFAKKQQTAYSLLFFAVAGILGFLVAGVIKVVFARYRPEVFFEREQYGFHFFSLKFAFNSMPSGHAVAAFAGFYAIATLLKKHWITIILMVLAILVGVSRVICDEHYASDVILGAYLGILSVYWSQAFLARFFSAKS